MLPSEAPRIRNSADTVFVLTVSRGLASPRTREFRVGEPQEAASVGSSGDWQLRGPGVEPIHAYLYFDGDALYVQSALEARELLCGGRRVGNDWELVSVADVIEIGTARITLSQTTQPRSGASAVARAPAAPIAQAPAAPVAPAAAAAPAVVATAPPALASRPVARAIISPQGAEAVTGEERTAFVPLDSIESQRTLPEPEIEDEPPTQAPSWSASDDEQEATRMPGLRGPSFGDDEDEATRMVSLEGKSAIGLLVPSPVIADDPYDDLQERTHASTGASAIVPYRPDTAMPFTPTGPVQLGSSRDVNAQALRSPSKIERRSEPPPAKAERLPEVQAYGAAPAKPKAPDPAPNSYPTPEPRAGWGGEVLKSEASRARASAEILGPSAAPRIAPSAPNAEASAMSRSIGEMTRVAPLGPEAEAKRKAAIARATAAETPSMDTPAVPLGGDHTQPHPTEETKRRKQKTARVRGPDGSGAYTPPPPPMALPQEENKEKPKKPPSGMKKAFDAFADHFEEVNTLRKILYLTSPFVLLTAAYIVFGPEQPPPSAQGPAIKAGEPPPIASSAPPPPTPAVPNEPLARPDAGEIPVEGEVGTTSADAGAPTGKKDPKAPKVVTPERLAADAYAAGQLDKAIALYRDLLARPEPMDPMHAAALTEVLRILESKRSSGQRETLEQAPPLKSAR